MKTEKILKLAQLTDLHDAFRAVQQLHHAHEMMRDVVNHVEFTVSYSLCWNSALTALDMISQELRIAQHSLECIQEEYDKYGKDDKSVFLD